MKTLKTFSAQELEELCGLEVDTLWVGSLWAGAYRTSRPWPQVLALELLVLGLMVVLSVPVGLGAMRWSPWGGQGANLAFGFGVVISTLLFAIGRWSWMGHNRRAWRSLLRLLEAVEHFHQMLGAFEWCQTLSAFGTSAPMGPNAPENQTLETALSLTRDSLVTGLRVERLLRDRQQRSRSDALLNNLDQTLATLHSLELRQQATEQAQLLREALQMSTNVREELQRLLPTGRRGH